MATDKKPFLVKLQSSDEVIVTVEKEVACESLFLKSILDKLDISDPDDVRLAEPISIQEVDGFNLTKSMEFCTQNLKVPINEDDPRHILEHPAWVKSFSEAIPNYLVPPLLEAAHSLEIHGLISVTAFRIATYLESKTIDELNQIFGIEDQVNKEEWKEIEERYSSVERGSQ